MSAVLVPGQAAKYTQDLDCLPSVNIQLIVDESVGGGSVTDVAPVRECGKTCRRKKTTSGVWIDDLALCFPDRVTGRDKRFFNDESSCSELIPDVDDIKIMIDRTDPDNADVSLSLLRCCVLYPPHPAHTLSLTHRQADTHTHTHAAPLCGRQHCTLLEQVDTSRRPCVPGLYHV